MAEMDLYEKFTRLGLNLFIESVKDLDDNDEAEESDRAEAVLPTGKIVHKKAIVSSIKSLSHPTNQSDTTHDFVPDTLLS